MFKYKAKRWGQLLKLSYQDWSNHDPFRNSAVIAYYTIFSLPGLVIILINVAGKFLGKEALENKIYTTTHEFIGDETAVMVEKLISQATLNNNLTITSIFSIATMLFGATGVFYQLKKNLNLVWNLPLIPKEKKFFKLLKDRVFSFGMILVVGFILLVSLIISSVIHGLQDIILQYIPYSRFFLIEMIDFLLSLVIVAILFAGIYKYLPDTEVKWKNVIIPALFSAFLFDIAKVALSYYFKYSNPASTYGAAGGIILLMLWVSYSVMILMFGAELSRVIQENPKDKTLH